MDAHSPNDRDAKFSSATTMSEVASRSPSPGSPHRQRRSRKAHGGGTRSRELTGLRVRCGELPPTLRARCDADAHEVPGTLANIERAVEERRVERCRCHVRALCRRVGDDSAEQARAFLQDIVQFGGADVLLSTLSLLPESSTPTAAVLALLNDAMYIRAAPCPSQAPRPLRSPLQRAHESRIEARCTQSSDERTHTTTLQTPTNQTIALTFCVLGQCARYW